MNTDPLNTVTVPARAVAPRFLGGGAITFEEHAVPEPGPGELLLSVKANALCGTDREQYYEGSAVTPGHEAAGIVAASGEGVSVAVGTAGVVYLMDYCGQCRSCRVGATNQCLHKRADMGFTHDGGYGPFELVHETNFFAIGDGVPIGDAPLLLDVMGTSTHAIRRLKLVHPDPGSLLITGAGPVGLGVAAMAGLTAPELRVFVSDVVPYRLELAQRLGATPLRAGEGPLGAQLVRQGASDIDLVVETSGKQVARQEALELLAQRGVMACVGHGEGLQLQVSSELIAPERTILGSEYFRYDEMPDNLALLREHGAFLAQIITHRFPLDRISEAFAAFLGGETGKVIVEQ